MTESATVRLGIPTLLLTSMAGACAVSLHTATSEIPAFAFGSHAVLAVQVTLLFFYAALLLLVPLMRALFDGALPVELSLKGARWAEEVVELEGEILERQDLDKAKALAVEAEIGEEIEEIWERIRDLCSDSKVNRDGI